MARNKQADKIYNARRRHSRSAVRHLQRAENSSGATAARERQLARQEYKEALKLYGSSSPAKKSKEIRQLEDFFGFGPQGVTRPASVSDDLISRSFQSLEGSKQDVEMRREAEARALLNDDTIGSRILGGLVDVWKDKATVTDSNGLQRVDNKKIVPALLDYFKVTNLADMVEKLEASIGEKLYDLKGDIDNIYEHVRLQIAEKVRDNTLVQ